MGGRQCLKKKKKTPCRLEANSFHVGLSDRRGRRSAGSRPRAGAAALVPGTKVQGQGHEADHLGRRRPSPPAPHPGLGGCAPLRTHAHIPRTHTHTGVHTDHHAHSTYKHTSPRPKPRAALDFQRLLGFGFLQKKRKKGKTLRPLSLPGRPASGVLCSQHSQKQCLRSPRCPHGASPR